MKYKLYNKDLPGTLKFNRFIAVDTETMGLNLNRDRLCLVQISNGDGIAHLVKISENNKNIPLCSIRFGCDRKKFM